MSYTLLDTLDQALGVNKVKIEQTKVTLNKSVTSLMSLFEEDESSELDTETMRQYISKVDRINDLFNSLASAIDTASETIKGSAAIRTILDHVKSEIEVFTNKLKDYEADRQNSKIRLAIHSAAHNIVVAVDSIVHTIEEDIEDKKDAKGMIDKIDHLNEELASELLSIVG